MSPPPAVYYNDSEPFVCDWLENLIREKLLPDGVVDRRPIQEVEPQDVQDFTQCHFFAGIGGWAYALQLAGWGDRPVWTGSCPCQPFSAAGKGQAEDDPRHLWPHWIRLIRECRPERVFGEQVANAAGKGWLDVVSTDLEAEAYTVGAVVLGAHSVGAPHLRQRIWFVADAGGAGSARFGEHGGAGPGSCMARLGVRSGLGNPSDTGFQGCESRDLRGKRGRQEGRIAPSPSQAPGRMADPTGEQAGTAGLARKCRDTPSGISDATSERLEEQVQQLRCGPEQLPTRPFPWACDWLPCTDGKSRPVEPGTFPLAHGIPQRVGRLRGYGNAIVPQVAAAFIEAYLDTVRAPKEPNP